MSSRTNENNRGDYPRVSVIVPTYNRSHLIRRAIGSVLDQTYEDFEVIVVDDGSTDNTHDVVKDLDDARIRYIRHERRRGPSAARNTGIRAARGEYTAFLDSDDEWLPRNLQEKVRALDSSSQDVGLAYSRVVRRLGRNLEYATPRRGLRADERLLDYWTLHGGLITVWSTVVETPLLADTLFDEQLHKHEDGDLLLRLHKVTRFFFVPEPLVVWHDEVLAGSDRISAAAHAEASRRFIEKHRDEFEASKRALAGLLYRVGVSCLTAGEIPDARVFLRESIACRPVRCKPVLLYLSTYLGEPFVRLFFRLLEVKVKLWIRVMNRL